MTKLCFFCCCRIWIAPPEQNVFCKEAHASTRLANVTQSVWVSTFIRFLSLDFISYSYRFIHFIISTFLTFQRSTRHTKWTTFPPSCPAPGGALCPQPQAPASPSVKTTPCVQTTRSAVTTAAGSPVVGTKISPARALGTSGTRTCVGWTARPTATARGWRSAVWRPVGAPAHGPATTICLTLPTRRPASGPPSGRCPTSVANYETNLNGKNQTHSAIHCL